MQKPSRLARSRQLDVLLDRLFYCPSCTTWRMPKSRQHSLPRPRHASSLASSTAINATKSIPPRFQGLYEALNDVKKKASAQVNLSRLQLALQGLESENPPTRVAVLGLNVPDTAVRIVRLMLADALEAEEPWEKQLLKEGEDYSQGVLIRYGTPPNASLPQARTSIRTLYIPSPVLHGSNVEILVSSVSVDAEGPSAVNASTTSDAFLSPAVGTPTSATGRQTVVSQPVHRSLLVGNGFNELFLTAELLASTAFTSSGDRKLINIAVNIPDIPQQPESTALIVDTAKAELGLAAIRKSLSEAATYEHNWLEANIPAMSGWLTQFSFSDHATDSSLALPVADLISSLLETTSSNLRSQSLIAAHTANSHSISSQSLSSLDLAIANFSRSAHEELQSGLASAWSSRNWRKLAWYKLFWRVDDVGLIVTDLVTNGWLPNTEKAVYELSGRLIQAGIDPVEVDLDMPEMQVEPVTAMVAAQLQTIPPELSYEIEPKAMQPVLTSRDGSHVSVRLDPPPRPAPLASAISITRASQMTQFIDSLTTTAQQLVLRTLSITGLTAGLSGLAYFSVTAGSIYEAGTIVALGTSFALWRMQGDWERARRGVEDGLLENGRLVVKRVEERMSGLVQEAGVAKEDTVEAHTRKFAEEAVERARIELRKVL